MRRKIKRWLTFALAFMLIITSVDIPSLHVKAETVTSDKTYNFNQLTEMTSGYQKSISSSGVLTISGMPQYAKEEYFLFPEEIEDTSLITKIAVNLPDGQSTSSLTIKMYDSSWSTCQNDGYGGSGVLNVDNSVTSPVGFSFMNKNADAMSIAINSVTITTKASATDDTTSDTTYDFNQLVQRYSGHTKSIGTNGVLNVSYTTIYQEVKYAFPAELGDTSKITKVAITMADGSSKKIYDLALKVYASDWSTNQADYNGKGSITIDSTVVGTSLAGFSIMGYDAGDAAIASVTFTVEEEVVDEDYTITVEAPTLKKDWASAETVALESGGYRVFFGTGSYAEARFDLPVTESIDLNQCESVTFKLAEANSQPVNFYLSTTDASYSTTKYEFNNQSGSATYVLDVETVFANQIAASTLGSIEEVGVQIASGADTATAEVKLSEIVFTMKGSGEDVSYNAYTITYKAAGLTIDENNNRAAGCEYKDGKYSLTYSGVNEETRFVFQDETTVDLSKCARIIFNTSNQVGSANYYVSTASGKIDNYYGKSGSPVEVTPAVTSGTVDSIYVQLGGSTFTEGSAIDLESVIFVMNGDGTDVVYDSAVTEEEAPKGNYTITVYADALTHDWSKSGITNTLGEDNRLEIAFGVENNDSRYDLPTTIDLANVEKVTFNVCDQIGRHNISLSLDGTKVGDPINNQKGTSFEMVPSVTTGTINEVVFQAAGWDYTADNTLTVESVVFTMKKTADETDKVYGDAPITEEKPPVDTLQNTTVILTGEEDYSWLSTDVTKGYDTTAASVLDESAARWAISFGGTWQEVRFKLPESIDMSMCNKMTIAVPDQSAALSFKLLENENDTTPVWAVYHESGKSQYSYSFTAADEFTANYIGIMLHSDDKVNATETASFDGITFDMKAEDEIIETYEISYGYSDLVYDWDNAATCELVDGGWAITMSDLNQGARFKLPELVNMEKCIGITYTVASQTGPVNFFTYLDSSEIEHFYYNVGAAEYTKTPTATKKINAIAVMSGGESFTEGAAVTLTGVTFLMEGKEPLPTPEDSVYTVAHLESFDSSEGVEMQMNDEDNSADILLPETGSTIIFEVPDSVDVNHLVSIDFNMSTSTAATFRLARSTENPEVTVAVLDKNLDVIASSNTGWLSTACNPEVKYISITAVKASTLVHLNSVFFEVDEDAFEAIVLNGNFAREDVSMWGKALWGSVDDVSTEIVAKTSDTAIGDGIYTYGEINRRSSPYVGFAQDITDRVKTGQWYSFTFWAKLSDDYAEAPAAQRVVEFAPYHLDANGVENYSKIPYGNYKRTLTVGEWTQFSGKVYVPADATGYVIRIVEQGTNYGKGDCVMGSYAVTGVYMEECDPAPTQTYSGGGGSSANTTITKETNYVVDYTMDDLTIDWASATTEKTNGNLSISFKNNYDEVRLKLPRTLDMSQCSYVKVKVPSQNVTLGIKLYYKGSQVDVGYYNNIQSEYILVPTYQGMIDAIGIMSLATPNPAGANAVFSSVTFGLTQEPAPLPVRTEIVLNGDFASDDLSDWMASFWGDGVTMTRKISSTEIGDSGLYTYASYSKRTSPYQCFAQDITEMAEQNQTYTFSFWARLSSDYEGAPAEQRVVQFAPYTVDADGNADYNPKLDGTYIQVLEPGVWTKFEGTYKVTNANEVKKVVIRILEQGTEYGQGDCVLGGYDVADVQMALYVPEPPSIDEDVPNLRDVLPEVFGDDFLVGTAATVDELDDIGVEMLINKHFNALTLGNELKPDALFGYSNDKHTKLQTVQFNGQSLEVPTLDFSRAEAILDKVLEWNEASPDNQIKVRGHVLVWHSQTPEWFFREGYEVKTNSDGTENYVTPEEMNLRLEWYIKTVLEHFLGEDSPYEDLFYGWDVVNEAVSDGGNGYRTDKQSLLESPSDSTHGSNSSWWAVYQSNEFIIKAFQYANKYAPADVELYYNDYNECDSRKSKSIIALLEDVLAAEGTRIDAMGMQGHYNDFNPFISDFESTIRAYAEVVGTVHITELDLRSSTNLTSEANIQKEYLIQAERYKKIYDVLRKLDAEDGIEIGCVTFWGTVDHHSWLQSSSDVGGGSTGDMEHCPLLFDKNYKVKPAYWAWVDYTMVDPTYVEEIAVEEPAATEAPAEESKEPEATPSESVAAPVEEVAVSSDSSSNAMMIVLGIGAAVIVVTAAAFAINSKKAGKKKEEEQ